MIWTWSENKAGLVYRQLLSIREQIKLENIRDVIQEKCPEIKDLNLYMVRILRCLYILERLVDFEEKQTLGI